jgi:hypothetical protein
MKNKNNKKIYLVYKNTRNLIQGVKILNKEKISIQQIYSPYPVHNIYKFIYNYKKNHLSEIAFISGLLGCVISSLLTWYTTNYDWIQNIGGKPSYSWISNFPSFIPVIFEFIIFFAAHCMFIYYLISCKLYPGKININPDPRTTNDKFMIVIQYIQNKKTLYQTLIKNGLYEIKYKI